MRKWRTLLVAVLPGDPAERHAPQGGHPDIHVPDVRATAVWYESIGFTILETYDDGGEGLTYGMREFVIRDPNGFWVTFGQNRSTG